MRTLLVATAAGALVLGSLTGATAAPGHKSNPKPVLQVVNIVGHTPLNVFKVNEDGWDDDERPSAHPPGDGQVQGDDAPADHDRCHSRRLLQEGSGKDLTPATRSQVDRSKKLDTTSKVNTFYWATHPFTVDEAKAMKDFAATSKRAWLCISTADVTGYTYPNGWDWSTQTRKRLNIGNVKPVRECVKIIDINPAQTVTTKDDPKPLP